MGLLIGAGIVGIDGVSRPMFERSGWPLFWINTGYAVVGYGLAGLVYGLVA